MLHYTESGQGFPLILIHGYCENSQVWQNLIPELSSNFRVLCPDLPGFGKSPPLEITTIENVAAEINEWLNFLNIDSCAMIGHSLGGYVTLAYAEEYGEKLTSIGLFHSTAMADNKEKKKTRTAVKGFLKDHGSRKFIDSLAPALFRKKTIKDNNSAYSAFLEIAYQSSEEAIGNYAIAMRDRRERLDVLHSFQRPLLFIAGKEDKVIPMDSSRKQAENRESISFQVLKASAHMGMYEEPGTSAHIIKEFLISSI